MRSPCAIACLGLLICCAFAQKSFAQTSDEGQAKEQRRGRASREQQVEARTRFQRGTELFAEGDYQAALAEFLRAQELSPHPLTLFNIANCHAQLNRYDEAIQAYGRAIREGPRILGQSRIREAREEIERLESLIATVALSVNLPMADVMLDGESLGEIQGERTLQIPAGTHTFEIRAEGYQTARRELTVAGGMSSRLDIVMIRQSRLGVDAGTSEADLFIDGHRAGRTPFEGGIPIGRHSLRVERDGYLPWEGEIEGAPGRSVNVRVELESGRHRLSSAWFWADMSLTLALGVAAAVTGGLALDRQGQFEAIVERIDSGDYDQTNLSQLRAEGVALMDEIDAYALACDVNLSLTGAFAVAALVFGLLSDLGRRGSTADIQISLRPERRSGLALGLTF